MIISDGITATDYFYVNDEWIITELTQVVPPTPSSMAGTCSCTREELSCSNFADQISAQACFDQCLETNGSDISNLDGDADGLACESLP